MLRSPAVLSLALAASTFAIPDDAKVDAIHAHPATTLLSAFEGNLNLTTTWERELPQPARSLVVQPFLGIHTFESPERRTAYEPTWGESRIWHIRASAGPRWYFNGSQHRGFYVAGMARAGIVRIDEEATADIAGTEGTLYIAGAMGYLGYRWATEHLSVFTDIGVGYDHVRQERTGRSFRVMPVMVGATGDVNIGMGYRF